MLTPMEGRSIYKIHGWTVESDTGVIVRGDESVHLEPKAMDLLIFLIENSQQVHARDELLDRLWPGVVVSDEALTNAITKLRKAFGDKAKDSKIIETVPKRGYRFIAEFEVIESSGQSPIEIERNQSAESENGFATIDRADTSPRATYPGWRNVSGLVSIAVGMVVLSVAYLAYTDWESSARNDSQPVDQLSLPEKPSIAVLPFVNVGNNIEDSYFSDGITDDLITDLSKISGLFVISRNSTFQFKGQAVDIRQIASTLGVRYVLEGSIRRSGNRVRVNTQLIDGTRGGQLWADRYEEEMKDIFALQDRITEQIIGALALKLTEQEDALIHQAETVNAEAYKEFLRGRQFSRRLDRDSFAQAEKHFKQALQLDPDYKQPHAGLAYLYIQAMQQRWHLNSAIWNAGWARAQKHLTVAMQQPSSLTRGLRSTIDLLNRRFDRALENARIAVKLNPNSAEGYLALAEVLSFTDQSQQAIERARKGRRQDPGFPAPYLLVEGRALFDLRKYNEAVDVLKSAIAENPDDHRPLLILVASFGHLDEQQKAQQYLKVLNQQLTEDRQPQLTIDSIQYDFPYQQSAAFDHMKSGLAKANVPKW